VSQLLGYVLRVQNVVMGERGTAMSRLELVRFSWERWKHSLPFPALALAAFETTVLGCAAYLLILTGRKDGLNLPDWIGLAIAIAFVTATATSSRKWARGQRAAPQRAIMPMPLALGLIASLGFVVIFLIGASGADGAGEGVVLQPLKVVLAWSLCLCMTRSLAARLSDLDAFKRRVLVLGTGPRAQEIARLASAGSSARFTPVGFVDIDRRMLSPASAGEADGGHLLRTAKELRVREIVVAAQDRRGIPVGPLLQCKAEGINVMDYVAFLEREGGRIDLDALQPSWFLYSAGFGPKRWGRWMKRSFDLIVSIAVLLLVLPLLLLAIAAIKLGSPGPAFVRQERVGWRGRPFQLLRLRLGPFESARPEWSQRAACSGVGRFIHKFRIDQLPQFWNVVRGDMSLVGPRADRPAILELLKQEIPFYCERNSMRPGVTGWAQINYPYGARLEDARQKLSYDLYYLKNWSLRRDVLVLMQALGFMLHQ